MPPEISPNNGRHGMDLWKILVLGTIRLNCNWDYDKLHEIVNNHKKIRQMLGHSTFDDDYEYPIQTLKDNVSLLTPETLDKINQIVVTYGHKVVGKKKTEYLSGSCDSFVIKTSVHFPTDINLLYDAIQKILVLIMGICSLEGISDWRQGKYYIRKAKKFYRKAQQLKHSSSKDDAKKADRERLIIEAHTEYTDLAQYLIDKIRQTLISLQPTDIKTFFKIEEVQRFIDHADRQIDQIRRRVVHDEVIEHHEKVFSLFEEHTEWISKGKAGVPVELGLKVCIVKDQYNFILHHHVMQKETDDKIAVSIIKETQLRFPDFNACSYDKGFHSPYNQKELSKLLDKVVLPRKGRLSAINKEIESSCWFSF